MELVKEQLNETWKFLNDMLIVSRYQNDGVVNVNTGAILNDVVRRLKDIYLEVEKYEAGRYDPTESVNEKDVQQVAEDN